MLPTEEIKVHKVKGYIIIGDIRGFSSCSPSDCHKRIKECKIHLRELNRNITSLIMPFTLQAGDEIQGIVGEQKDVINVIKTLPKYVRISFAQGIIEIIESDFMIYRSEVFRKVRNELNEMKFIEQANTKEE